MLNNVKEIFWGWRAPGLKPWGIIIGTSSIEKT